MLLLLLSLVAYAQDFVFSGKVVDRKTSEPVEFATVVLESTGQWAIADAKGCFEIKGVRACKTNVIVSSLGYVEDSREITIARSITNYTVYLNVDNLALEGALVTAQDNSNSATTSRLIDRNALNHVQMLNISDITSLLPGGVTSNPSLLSEHNITIRSGGSGEAGNALFGAAIEVDGARLSNNGSFGNADLTGVNLRGVSTNNIASSNVESVEVISGVASVEYGDMTSGVVKINTRKGKTPYTITMSTTPTNKQVSVGKGFGLKSKDGGKLHGTLNANLEHTRSISEPMSPYTSYSRSQINLLYSNTFTSGAFSEAPLRMSFGVTGNLGGRNDKTDPDRYQDSYTKALDNNLRANLTMDWLLNRKWITNIEFKASASYSDKSQESKTYYSSSVTSVSLHGEDRGYFMSEPFSGAAGQKIIQLKPGYYSNVMNWDDRPVYFKASVKANWATTWGKVNSKIKLGADFTGDKNLGRGQYSAEMDTAPSFREYRYDLVPLMFNGAAYLEENLTFPVGKGRMNFIAGIRNDNTVINGSEYGTVSSWSPRFNWKYTVLDAKGRGREALRSLAVKAGWGKSVKLPAFAVLYPRPGFYDIEVFRSTVSSDNTVSSAFFVMPREVEFNRSLRWQNNRQAELGVDFNLYGIKIGLVGYYTTTHDSYRLMPEYEPFSYMYTLTSALSDCPVPAADRVFSISQGGVVTVSDRNGVIPSVQLDAQKRDQFVSRTLIDNDDNPIRRCGLEWTVEFPKIKPVNTTIMLDGNYYDYRSVYTDMKVDCPASTVAANGKLYPYKAYYYGGNSIANGNISRSLRNNLTIVTHIPKVRMIVSLKLEASLLKYSQALSERYDGKQRSYSIADRGDPTSVDTRDIYDGEGYTVMYPDYIVSLDGTRMEFLDKYRWAKDNDKAMYADLSKLVVVSNYKYIFLPEYISPYFSANLSVTKEIGDIASISFYANNFFNNMGQVYSTKTGTYSSVASYIPSFYYGLTLRLKF